MQSCLALKIIYNEQDTDFVFTVSPGKLYVKCKKQKIPFHLWYTWIEKELQKVNDLQKRAVEAQARPKSLMERLMGAISNTGNRQTPRQNYWVGEKRLYSDETRDKNIKVRERDSASFTLTNQSSDGQSANSETKTSKTINMICWII